MHYLVDNLVIFVGDLVPIGNPIWKLYLMMRQITNIVLFDIVSDEIIVFFFIHRLAIFEIILGAF